MAGRVRTKLPELLELIHGQVVAGQMKNAVEQRRRVAVRKDETVAVNPVRIPGVVLHQLVVEQVGNGRASQWSSGMAAIGFLYLVHGEKPQGVDRQLVECVLLLLFGHSVLKKVVAYGA